MPAILYPKKRTILEYIDQFIKRFGYAPTLREIGEAVGVHSPATILQDLAQRLSGQGLDLETYLKVRNTTREKFIEEEVQPVARKRLERGLILDEVVRREGIQLDNESLDNEYNSSLSNLAMQGVNFSKIRGGRQGQKRISQAIAMDAANRLMTRKALDMLKSIATGNYTPIEAVKAQSDEGAAQKESAGDQGILP